MNHDELIRLYRLMFMRLLLELYIDLYVCCLMQHFQQPNADYLGESSNA